MRRLDLSLNAIGAAMRRLSGNILAPTLYCIYVLQLLAIISTEAVRDGFALLFFFVIHSFRPFYCLRKIHAAQGRFSAQQMEKAKKYLLEQQEATKNRFCYLPQRSSETSERIISASLSGDWFHQVLGGLPLINTQNMQPEKKPPAQKSAPSGKEKPPSGKEKPPSGKEKSSGEKEKPVTTRNSASSGKDKFPRLFALVKPAASAPIPPRQKITTTFQLARVGPPTLEKGGNVSSASSKRSIESIYDLRNPWADQRGTKAQSGTSAKPEDSAHLESSASLKTARSGNHSEKAKSQEKVQEAPEKGQRIKEEEVQKVLEFQGMGQEKTEKAQIQKSLEKSIPEIRQLYPQTAPSGSSIRSKIIQFEKLPPGAPPAFPER